MASMYESSLDAFSPNFEKLIGLYPNEFERYRLDEIVVAAISPTVRICEVFSLYCLLNGFYEVPPYVDAMATSRRPWCPCVQFPAMEKSA